MSRPQLQLLKQSSLPSPDEDDEDEPREEYVLTIEDAKTILCKMVERAVLDFQLGPKVRSDELQEAYKDAKQWLFSDSQEFPAFLAVCDHLDLDADAVRDRIMRPT